MQFSPLIFGALALASLSLSACGSSGSDSVQDPSTTSYESDHQITAGSVDFDSPRYSGSSAVVIGKSSDTAIAGTYRLQSGHLTIQSSRQ